MSFQLGKITYPWSSFIWSSVNSLDIGILRSCPIITNTNDAQKSILRENCIDVNFCTYIAYYLLLMYMLIKIIILLLFF